MIIKICGIQTLEDAQVARQSGADMIGFVFAPSRRYLAPKAAAAICKESSGIAKVGVFVDEHPDLVNEIADLCGLDYVQLHGSETPEYITEIRYPVIKAFRFDSQFQAERVNTYKTAMGLIDSYQHGVAGGTGITFPWEKARSIFSQIQLPLLIAGGLSIENVDEAIMVLRPYGIDVSGGVEEDGIKSAAKIYAFVTQVRKAEGGIA